MLVVLGLGMDFLTVVFMVSLYKYMTLVVSMSNVHMSISKPNHKTGLLQKVIVDFLQVYCSYTFRF